MSDYTVDDKLISARCRLMTREPFYGAVAINIDWLNAAKMGRKDIKTMGVRIVNGGQVQCIYSPEFVEARTLQELFGVVMHELEHLIRLHCVRRGDRHHEIYNIAADMAINGTKEDPRIGFLDEKTNRKIMPFDSEKPDPETGKKPECIFIPKGWDKNGTSEEFYDKLLQEAKQLRKKAKKGKKGENGGGSQDDSGQGEGQKGDGQGEQGEGEGDGNGGLIFGDMYGVSFDDHSVWNESDVSVDEARQIIHEIVKEAAEKSRGKIPGHLEEAIAALKKPIVRWRELLRQYMGKHIGNRRVTWARMNRRRPEFGNPGHSTRAAATVTVIVDTSGSVGGEELAQFFTEIDNISYRSKVSILQWDHAFQGYSGHYRRGDWRKFAIKGRGGTDMQAPINFLMENRLIGDCTIMLTDGYCNWSEPKPFPMITCITGAPKSVTPPTWGHVVWLGRDN